MGVRRNRRFVGFVAGCGLALLAGCVMPNGDSDPVAVPPTAAVESAGGAAPTATYTATVPAVTDTPDANAPVVLLEQELGAGTVSLLRFQRGAETCVSATFNLQTFEASQCGTFSGAGVGFVGTVTDPAGMVYQIAYGLVLDESITAVAVEFPGGSNTNTQPRNGGFLFVLQSGQAPHTAYGVNLQGNLVGQWGFQ
ncbi:MAG: hypothetical protein JW910_23640 [Anaerolineae bacterium]|nr:hypothetical protein [Anaerolineae bacterium]